METYQLALQQRSLAEVPTVDLFLKEVFVFQNTHKHRREPWKELPR